MNLGAISYIISWALSDRKPDLVVTPGELGRLLHVAQLKYLKRRLGAPEDYKPGAPIPKEVYEISKTIKDDVRQFLVLMGGDNPALAINDDGEATLPDDFYFPSTISYKYAKDDESWEWREVDIVTDKEFLKRQSSFIKRPSLKWPCANIYGSKIRFAPSTMNYVDFLYIKTPTQPVFGVTTTRGFQEYDPTTSTELEWSDSGAVDIIAILLADLGINISNNDLINYSQNKQTTG